MRTRLSLLTHLFALSSMYYLPEWNIVNNNNKYTQNINGDINGMLTDIYEFRSFELYRSMQILRIFDQSECGKKYVCPIKTTLDRSISFYFQILVSLVTISD